MEQDPTEEEVAEVLDAINEAVVSPEEFQRYKTQLVDALDSI